MLDLYYNYWEYWNLYHKVTFDGDNKLILINDGVVEIDVQTDIYSAWKEWLLVETNARYLQAIDTVGGEPTVAGQFLDVTYFLINGWKLKPYSGSYQLNIIGNIFDIDGGDIKVPADIKPLISNNISLNTNTSVIVRQLRDTTGATSSLAADERAALFNIEDKVIEIRSILSAPVTANLATDDKNIMLDIQEKMLELWKLHGLDKDNDLLVSQNARVVDDIVQVFTKNTDGTLKVNRI